MILFKFKWYTIMIHCNVTSSDIDKTQLKSDIEKLKYFLYARYKDIAREIYTCQF